MTRSELLSLLRDAETALVAALYGDTKSALPALGAIGNALRAETAATSDGACPVCRIALVQPQTGRPRTYCGGACKKRAYRARQKG